jgi:tRNA threonylcarbamoyladenosine biosynthesis protein TsaB
MRVLALDAATESCSVALWCDGEIIDRTVEAGKGHAPQLLAMIQDLLAEAQLTLASLDGLAASIGPGSFTGVRISVAVAQGVAFGASLAVVPVTTLEALALPVLQAGADCALACLDARMGEVYWGCFAPDSVRGVVACKPLSVGPPGSVGLDGLGDRGGRGARGIGRGFSAYPDLAALPGVQVDLKGSRALPQARDMARLGALRLKLGAGIDPADLTPLYLRDKVALTEAERAARP